MQASHVERKMKEVNTERDDLLVTKKATSFAWTYFSCRKVDVDQKQGLPCLAVVATTPDNMAN